MLANTYPVLTAFWYMLVFFAFVIWIWLLITVFADLFRRHDTSGWSKALWIIFIIIAPYLGVLIYIIAEHQGMANRNAAQMQAQKEATDDYIRSTAAAGDPAEQIAKGKQLLDSGAITQAEYDDLKKKALAT